MLVVPQHELFESWGCEAGFGAAVVEAAPSDGDWGVNVDEDEEGSAGEGFDYAFVVDGGCNVVGLPVFGYVLD